jgi:uroporphyrin-3 C-methyltransferase
MTDETVDPAPTLPDRAEHPPAERGSAARARPRNGRSAAAVLLALIALGVAGYAAWRGHLLESERAAGADPQKLAAQVEALTHSMEQLRGNADSVRARLDDTAKVDKSEREELLGLGERARLLEDAVANLADKRLSGRDTLALDEAELLLNLGAERFALFHDAAAASSAYRLADNALAEVENAAFSTVRQSVAAEIQAFEAARGADTQALLGRLTQARTRVLGLRTAQHVAAPGETPAGGSRLWRVLGALVQVRHDDDAQGQLQHRDAGLARELAALDLHTAQAALLARDDAQFHAALASTRAQLAAFDRADTDVADVFAALDGLDQAQLAPPPPSLLGTALKELRNLRATHALRAVAPHNVTKADEAQK